jgi:hypothetical protein
MSPEVSVSSTRLLFGNQEMADGHPGAGNSAMVERPIYESTMKRYVYWTNLVWVRYCTGTPTEVEGVKVGGGQSRGHAPARGRAVLGERGLWGSGITLVIFLCVVRPLIFHSIRDAVVFARRAGSIYLAVSSVKMEEGDGHGRKRPTRRMRTMVVLADAD